MRSTPRSISRCAAARRGAQETECLTHRPSTSRTKVRKVAHHAALPFDDMPAFLATLRGRPGMAARALEFAIYTAARTAERRVAMKGTYRAGTAVRHGPRGKRSHHGLYTPDTRCLPAGLFLAGAFGRSIRGPFEAPGSAERGERSPMKSRPARISLLIVLAVGLSVTAASPATSSSFAGSRTPSNASQVSTISSSPESIEASDEGTQNLPAVVREERRSTVFRSEPKSTTILFAPLQ